MILEADEWEEFHWKCHNNSIRKEDFKWLYQKKKEKQKR